MYPFSTPTPPDAALSPLPPRLSLRSSHPSSPSPPTGTPRSDSGTSRWSAALMPEYLEAGVGGGVSEWGMGGYGDLLSHDPRGSIVSFSQVTQGHTANGARGDRQDSRDSRDSRVVLLDGGITLAGASFFGSAYREGLANCFGLEQGPMLPSSSTKSNEPARPPPIASTATSLSGPASSPS